MIVKARPKAAANKATPAKDVRRTDYARGGKAASNATAASEATSKATSPESAMAETCAAKAAVASDAVSERQGACWYRRSAEKTGCSERNRYPA